MANRKLPIMREGLYGYVSIGRAFGVSGDTVKRWLKRAGISLLHWRGSVWLPKEQTGLLFFGFWRTRSLWSIDRAIAIGSNLARWAVDEDVSLSLPPALSPRPPRDPSNLLDPLSPWLRSEHGLPSVASLRQRQWETLRKRRGKRGTAAKRGKAKRSPQRHS